MMLTTAAIAALSSLLLARTVTLDEAERTAVTNHPQVRLARANTEAADARSEQARAPALPQVKLQLEYQRTTGNRAQKPGRITVPGNPMTDLVNKTYFHNTFDTYNWWDGEVTGSLVLWDFGQIHDRWRAAEVRAAALGQTERAVRLQTLVAVRAAFFRARAQKALVEVARQTLANEERHFSQIEGFVRAGSRPEIDLAQARVTRAQSHVQLINAENAYAMARASLNEAMGVVADTEYDVADQTLPPVQGETTPIEALVAQAVRERPDIRALEGQIRAQELTERAARAGYGPTLSLIAGAGDAGVHFHEVVTNPNFPTLTYGLAWNVFAGLRLDWPIFQGFLTRGQVREAGAALSGLYAQRDQLIQQVWVGVQQAALAVRSAREALAAADEVLTNARERLRLAEGRYQAGVGNAIELGDAQVAATGAAAQRVSAEYNLSAARAELAAAIASP